MRYLRLAPLEHLQHLRASGLLPGANGSSCAVGAAHAPDGVALDGATAINDLRATPELSHSADAHFASVSAPHAQDADRKRRLCFAAGHRLVWDVDQPRGGVRAVIPGKAVYWQFYRPQS